jgi:Rod binding domain-containing protein
MKIPPVSMQSLAPQGQLPAAEMAARQFESMLLEALLRPLELLPRGTGASAAMNDVYTAALKAQLAEAISSQQGLGVGLLLESESLSRLER